MGIPEILHLLQSCEQCACKQSIGRGRSGEIDCFYRADKYFECWSQHSAFSPFRPIACLLHPRRFSQFAFLRVPSCPSWFTMLSISGLAQRNAECWSL